MLLLLVVEYLVDLIASSVDVAGLGRSPPKALDIFKVIECCLFVAGTRLTYLRFDLVGICFGWWADLCCLDWGVGGGRTFILLTAASRVVPGNAATAASKAAGAAAAAAVAAAAETAAAAKTAKATLSRFF